MQRRSKSSGKVRLRALRTIDDARLTVAITLRSGTVIFAASRLRGRAEKHWSGTDLLWNFHPGILHECGINCGLSEGKCWFRWMAMMGALRNEPKGPEVEGQVWDAEWGSSTLRGTRLSTEVASTASIVAPSLRSCLWPWSPLSQLLYRRYQFRILF